MNLTIIRNLLLVLGLGVVVFGAGYRMGENNSHFSYNLPTFSNTSVPSTINSDNIDFSLFWDVWKRLGDDYINKKALDPKKMFYGAISGMVSSLDDPYTAFLPPLENKDSKDSLAGHFEGIGAQLGVKDKKIIVVAPLSGTPADKAGLKSGDFIVKVDGKETYNWSLPEAVTHIRGEKGTKVVLNIFRDGENKARDISIVRDTINVPSVEWDVKSVSNSANKVVYLKLSQFGGSTNDGWTKAVSEIDDYIATDSGKRVKGLVLDLRNNPGGYLNGAVFIGSEFLKSGAVVLQEDANGSRQAFNVNRTGDLLNIPMMVLVDGGSASASEIVAGVLQDRGRAKLVGETTYGKGTIQDVQDLPGGAGLHITVAKWLLPSGKWINGKGLTPDFVVALDEKNPDVDTQLDKAIGLLGK